MGTFQTPFSESNLLPQTPHLPSGEQSEPTPAKLSVIAWGCCRRCPSSKVEQAPRAVKEKQCNGRPVKHEGGRGSLLQRSRSTASGCFHPNPSPRCSHLHR